MLKIRPFERWIEETFGDETVYMYIGIRADENRGGYDTSKPSIQLALRARLVAIYNSDCRWIGKGTALDHRGDGDYRLAIPDDVGHAVDAYRKRVQKHKLPWSEVGMLPSGMAPTENDFVLSLRQSPEPIRLRKTGAVIEISYLPGVASARELAGLLRLYEKAIAASFGTSLNAILHTLVALAHHVLSAIPKWSSDQVLAYDDDPADKEFAQRLHHLVAVGERGYIMLDTATLREKLSSKARPPWSNSPEEVRDHVNSFFNAFLLDKAKRDAIQVPTLEPYHILYATPSECCYVDLVGLGNFYRDIVIRCRDWTKTGHGDEFTLDVRDTVQKNTNALVLPKLRGIIYPDTGREADVDLPIRVGNRLYNVECKAYAKSRDFWLGDPEATNQRTQKLKEFVGQAGRAADAVRRHLSEGKPGLPADVTEVDWIVCTASHEYLKPLNVFGMLDDETPRVCTPEELVAFLKRAAG